MAQAEFNYAEQVKSIQGSQPGVPGWEWPDSCAHAEPEELKNVPQERDKLRRGAENAPRRSAIFGSFSSRKTGRFGVYFCHWDIPCYTDEEAV